jgi:hypothetical protein
MDFKKERIHFTTRAEITISRRNCFEFFVPIITRIITHPEVVQATKDTLDTHDSECHLSVLFVGQDIHKT